ncbi:helix-turn-helix domain-containing protein (plasmid) [Streptomyces sp. NBC_00868]|uniref:AraC-like ligand-binding domain-containing protein n=1 Tax=Streptomyces sp. NBC_00868 TaxID=2903683 RepID=UPI002F908188|nr:helix-turn-helix domain-containing protein [Streptomyces sp. NBC_00868]
MLVTELSTEVVPAPERFALFEEFAAGSHMRNRLRSQRQDDFTARMRSLTLGDLQLSLMALPHLEIVRTPKLIRQSDLEVYQVHGMIHGMGGLSQAERDAAFRAGEFVLVDSSRPFSGCLATTPGAWSSIVVQMPRSLVPLPENTVRRMTAVPIPATRGLGGVFHRWLVDLVTRAEEFTPADVPTLTQTTVDLLASLLGRCLDAEATMGPDARRRALKARIHDFVRQRLREPGLTPEAVAAAHGISTRYLYMLFRDQELTMAAWIRELRLENCRRDLADSRLLSRPIHSIAASWCFSDAAHFSRAFRAAYGISPRDYRHSAVRESSRILR